MKTPSFGRKISALCLSALSILFLAPGASAQFRVLESDDLRLVYFDVASDYLVRHTARSFTNSLRVYRTLLPYEPTGPVTLFLNDGSDYGNASADVLPNNRMNLSIAPLNYAFETAPANERINSTLHHELIHVASNDQLSGRERFFSRLFGGKVAVDSDDPLTIVYSYATSPRRYAPRWYQEGIAVFMETWMSGGLGRTMGGYDEMVFRTKVLENGKFYGLVGLESEGTAVDFQVGVNSYLYGTRFMSYVALTYGPEKVKDWFMRPEGSRANFAAQFKKVVGKGLDEAWNDWIDFEKSFQTENLARIRKAETSRHRFVSERALGSISRAFVDRASNRLLTAANYPGVLPHLAAIDLATGETERLLDVRGPMLFTVCALAFDETNRRLFYSSDNSRWRDLRSYDLATGEDVLLMKNTRVGDLAFNAADGSLWGVRHDLGLSTIVKFDPPYNDWKDAYAFPYGTDVYDLDVSPDGQWLIASRAEINGHQTLIRMPARRGLTAADIEPLFDFQYSNPESFVFSPDGKYLYGSSYFSGVSNLYRYEFEEGVMRSLTNAESGYFRPVPLSQDSLAAFVFTDRGFQPVLLPDEATSGGEAIHFLGDQIVQKHPIVTRWIAPPPSRVNLGDEGIQDSPYRALASLRPETVIPVVLGYKESVGYGLRVDITDPVGMISMRAVAAYSPDPALPAKERLHAAFSFDKHPWSFEASLNGADFYDLFGPKKNSRRGWAGSLGRRYSLMYDSPKRNLNLNVRLSGYVDIERLPDAQNIGVGKRTAVANASVSMAFQDTRSTIGSVDDETGVKWSLGTAANMAGGPFIPRAWGTLEAGTLLAPHVSTWIRLGAGAAAGRIDDPFARFYFGGFRNNWVDHQSEQRFRTMYAFPGLDIDAVGGRTFGKLQIETILPPVRFREFGGAFLYLKWLRPSVFANGISTDFDSGARRTQSYGYGGQVDARIMLFSYLSATVSAGYARGRRGAGPWNNEFMVSLKLL